MSVKEPVLALIILSNGRFFDPGICPDLTPGLNSGSDPLNLFEERASITKYFFVFKFF